MPAKKTIAIIGASEKTGVPLAIGLSKSEYRVLLNANDENRVVALAEQIKAADPSSDIEAIACNYNASWEADIIILALSHTMEREIAGKIREVANQKIVISVSNLPDQTCDGLTTGDRAEELQQLLPNSKIVKADFAADFDVAVTDAKPIDVLLAGNDEEAIEIASILMASAGLNPVVTADCVQ